MAKIVMMAGRPRSKAAELVDPEAPGAALTNELTIGELAATSGVPATTLRFYDKLGLITARRTTGNQRRYPRTTLRRLALVKAAQQLEVPLADIAEALPADRDPTPEEWRELLDRWRAALDDRIARLQELQDRARRLALCDCAHECAAPARCIVTSGHADGVGKTAARLRLRYHD